MSSRLPVADNTAPDGAHSKVEIQVLDRCTDGRVQRMTFPAYRRLLACRRRTRGDRLALVVASVQGIPVGLSLAFSRGTSDAMTLASMFVHRHCRARGLGHAMLSVLQEHAAQNGYATLDARYSLSTSDAFTAERLLARCGWSAPVTVGLMARCPLDTALAQPVFAQALCRRLAAGLTYEGLNRRNSRALSEVGRGQGGAGWVPSHLHPSRFFYGTLSKSSRVILDGRDIVGWILVHLISDGVVRVSCSFLKPEFARRGSMLAAWRSTFESMRSQGINRVCCSVEDTDPAMMAFVRRRFGFADVYDLRYSSKTVSE